MAIKSLLLLATAALATAEFSVVSMFIPDVEGTALVASVIAQTAGTTTYSINCPPGTDSSDCGVSPGLFLTSGPKKVEYSISEGDFYGRMICSLGGTTTAVCTDINSGAGANFPGTHTTTLASSDITSLPVTITAGATTGAASDTSASTTESSTTATSDTPASQTSASSSGAMASPTSSSTGGMSQITGAPVLALGAAVAFVAGAL
ncbi:hypothetical protein N7509_000559 [Penicillium cosmopolitanum]|uniref:GPI anchored protein n=1 Tax=Penicillium cosmopolitanum TaxID=1131564 RepID=A0A9W9WAT7_9EURO|nr:uncharacterized protein N7509_000559 [Penicillium cosmopolitanum]KAJ5413932.1 hypothetical protein N7509_000559 [Penicillium cosmopolitanum]